MSNISNKESLRWNEIKLYLFCKTFLKETNNIAYLFNLIDALYMAGNYSPEIIKGSIQEILSTHYCIPQKSEIIYLATKAGIGVRAIQRLIHCNSRIYYAALKEEQYIFPRLSQKQHNEIQKLINILEIVKGAVI